MTLRLPLRCALLIGAALVLLFPSRARAAVVSEEVMCDPSHQDCRAMLLTYIQNERISIDLAMWFMEDQDLANAIIASKNAGVSVRILVDPRRNAETPMNAVILDMFRRAGIPMRQSPLDPRQGRGQRLAERFGVRAVLRQRRFERQRGEQDWHGLE